MHVGSTQLDNWDTKRVLAGTGAIIQWYPMIIDSFRDNKAVIKQLEQTHSEALYDTRLINGKFRDNKNTCKVKTICTRVPNLI